MAIAKVQTVAFLGIEAKPVEVQCALAPGLPAFSIVGLPDKAVSEARDRVRASLAEMSIALPAKRITINLSPADLPKEGSHFDLALAFALLSALEILPPEAAQETLVLGELSLDGRLMPVAGALPAALTAAEQNRALLCPQASSAEAAWVDGTRVIGANTLTEVIRHFIGQTVIEAARPGEVQSDLGLQDLADVKGQEIPKRALEIAAAGRHHLLMTGPPGSGKSMLAARMPSILPPLDPREALETAMIQSIHGMIEDGGIDRIRPYRSPHHTASMAAVVGGGRRAHPGEISLAHNGVLFLDELPEFARPVLETLRQPVETGEVMVARANAHVTYPCRFMLVAAANPCKCGYMGDAQRACARAPQCGADYMGRISGPLMDRFDLRVHVPALSLRELDDLTPGESSAVVAARVAAARSIQAERYLDHPTARLNSDAEGQLLEHVARPNDAGRETLLKAADKFNLTARGYHRVLRVSRTIADLDGDEHVNRDHILEALHFRLQL
ncbi:YifB family Mg chelatase-like AAA ATPase [Tritonibacter multivorans]|uniref:YifB family Mg chelatase-like AAA ATPase n=1 Tax=Tritonibacter multivorans TaxID=928856 RepID=UPI000A3ECDB6|nr:YifB family Mg chelatase-like AAA ATPase [Tritonibacter multivorans]MDA7421158.1 YifB family Mg chelatase-like AAA ATPase [Tritonibacter multivorans]